MFMSWSHFYWLQCASSVWTFPILFIILFEYMIHCNYSMMKNVFYLDIANTETQE